jgi:hypothetical protein
MAKRQRAAAGGPLPFKHCPPPRQRLETFMQQLQRTVLLLLLLICAFAARAQEQAEASTVEAQYAALQKATEQEEATEHAPIPHEKPPAVLEDVDDYSAGLAGGGEVRAENEMENQNVEMGSKTSHVIDAVTVSGSYSVAVPVKAEMQTEVELSGCLASPLSEECSGHGVCKVHPGVAQQFCECTDGWFGPQCQCGEQAEECSESSNCHWCGSLSLCLMSKEECEAGEIALHGQVLLPPPLKLQPNPLICTQEHHNLDSLPKV